MTAENGFSVAHPPVQATLAVVKEVAEVESLSATRLSPDPKAPIPRQIRYIIGDMTTPLPPVEHRLRCGFTQLELRAHSLDFCVVLFEMGNDSFHPHL